MVKIYPRPYLISLILLLLIVGLISIVGCSPNGGKVKLNPQHPVDIVIWHYYHGAQKTAFDNAVKEFNETTGYEQGIIVEAVSYGGVTELAENVIAAARGDLDAGSMPNIFGSYGDTALEILNMQMAVEIDKYLTKEELDEYEESFIHEGKIGTDKLYVFPIAKSTESLMINKTDFDIFISGLKSSGVNEIVSYDDLATWEGILKVADIYYQYTDSLTPNIDNDGKSFLGIDSLANYIIIGSKQLGQDLVQVENGKAIVNIDKAIMSKLWYTYYKPMVTGRFVKLGRFSSDDIKTGDSLCFVGSTASASYFPTELSLGTGEIKNVEMMVLPMPVFENGDKVAISQGAGMVIAKSNKQKEYASAIFLKWFTESTRNVSFALNSSYLPVKAQSLNEDILNQAFAVIKADDVGTQNSIKALKVGIEQLKSYTLYSCEVFDEGVAFRDNLPTALSDAVKDDRISYLDLIQAGLSSEQAYSEVLEQNQNKFDEWLNFLRK